MKSHISRSWGRWRVLFDSCWGRLNLANEDWKHVPSVSSLWGKKYRGPLVPAPARRPPGRHGRASAKPAGNTKPSQHQVALAKPTASLSPLTCICANNIIFWEIQRQTALSCGVYWDNATAHVPRWNMVPGTYCRTYKWLNFLVMQGVNCYIPTHFRILQGTSEKLARFKNPNPKNNDKIVWSATLGSRKLNISTTVTYILLAQHI